MMDLPNEFGPYKGIEEHAFVNIASTIRLRVFVYTYKEVGGETDLHDNGVAILDETDGEVLVDGLLSSEELEIDLVPTPDAFGLFDRIVNKASLREFEELIVEHPNSRFTGLGWS